MELRIQIVAIVASAGLLLGILELVRQRRLLERYALLWLFAAFVLLALAIWSDFLETISRTIGVLLHFSMAVSRLADQSKVLAQRVAMLEERQQRAEARAAEEADGEPALERTAGR